MSRGAAPLLEQRLIVEHAELYMTELDHTQPATHPDNGRAQTTHPQQFRRKHAFEGTSSLHLEPVSAFPGSNRARRACHASLARAHTQHTQHTQHTHRHTFNRIVFVGGGAFASCFQRLTCMCPRVCLDVSLLRHECVIDRLLGPRQPCRRPVDLSPPHPKDLNVFSGRRVRAPQWAPQKSRE